MKKKKYGIIGKPISHSLSPTLHNFWFQKYKISANYSLIEVELNKIEDIIKKIKNNELQGINVTVPYKQAVIAFLDVVENEAKETQSVNTINLNYEGKVVGNNTDVYGFEQGFINKLNISNIVENKVLILGAGGVSPSVIYALARKRIKQIFISNRTLKKAEDIKKKFPFIEIIAWEDIDANIENIDIIINTTSLGLKDGANFKQEFHKTKSNLVYCDVIYNPTETMMIKKFKKNKLQTHNGLEMFMYQAQKSFYLWNAIKPEINKEIEKIIMMKL